jgi:hypothetical protein
VLGNTDYYLYVYDMKRKNPFKRLIENVRRSARSGRAKGQLYGRTEPLEVNIDEKYLEWLYNKEDGYCPYYKSIGVYKKINMDLVYETFTSLAPSVDRIDSNKGYVKGNVVITFRGINLMKQSNSLETFLKELDFLTVGNVDKINNPIIKQTKIMNTRKNDVEVLDTTVDFERVMNQFTSSFTESFIKVVQSQFGNGVLVREVIPVVDKPTYKNINISESRYSNSNENTRKNIILRNENLKPYTTNKNLKPASVVFGVKKAASLVNRSEMFWRELVKSGSLYEGKNGNVTEFMVDVKTVPQWLLRK